MKSIILSSAVLALLVFSGCSKEPIVDEATQPQSKSVDTETVSSANTSVVGEGGMDSSDTNEMRLANLEKSMTSIYFDFDKFVVRTDMQDNLSNDAKIANATASAYSVKLEGNCDEWGSDEYNFALALKRANTVKKALVAEGVAASRISMVSYGETNPTCSDKTQACWSKNRRVDFKLLP